MLLSAEEQAEVDALKASLQPTAKNRKAVNSANSRDLDSISKVIKRYRKRNSGAQIACVVVTKNGDVMVDQFYGDRAGKPGFMMAVYKLLFRLTFAESWPVIGEHVFSASDQSAVEAVLDFGVVEGYLAREQVVNLLAALAGGEKKGTRTQR
jgi:hypothetical protein